MAEKSNPDDKRETIFYSTISSQNNREHICGVNSTESYPTDQFPISRETPNDGPLERLEAYVAENRSVGYVAVLEKFNLTLEQLRALAANSKRIAWGSHHERLNWIVEASAK